MPLSDDAKDTLKHFKKEYGDEEGERNFYKWINKHGLDDEKSLSDQKGKMDACPECEMHKRAFAPPVGKEPDQKMAGNMVNDLVEPKAEEIVPTTKTEKNEKEVDFHDRYMEAYKLLGSLLGEAHHLDKEPPDGIPYEPGGDHSHLHAPQATASASSFKMPALRFGMQFKADSSGALSTGDIRGEGTLVSQTEVENKNGWRIGKRGKETDEFDSIANQIVAAWSAQKPTQVRLQHSDQPDKIIGGFYAGKSVHKDGYWGVDTTFFMNPKDPQVRYNIERGLLRDMSIGLDANAFCDVCDTPLRQKSEAGSGEMWDYACEHIGSPVYLTGCRIREGSIVSEPAFEGSSFKVSFAAALAEALPRSLNSNSGNNALVSNTMSAQVEAGRAKGKAESDAAENPFEADEYDKLLLKSKAYKALKASLKAKLNGEAEGDAEGEASRKTAEAEGDAEGEAARHRAYSDPNLGQEKAPVGDISRHDSPPNSKNVIPAKAAEEEEEKADASARAKGEAEGEGEADASRKTASAPRKLISVKTQTVVPPAKTAATFDVVAKEMTDIIMAHYQRKKPAFRGAIEA